MTFINCMQNAVDTGSIDKDKAAKVVDQYKQEYDRLKTEGKSDVEADLEASDLVSSLVKAGTKLEQKRKILAMRASYEAAQEFDRTGRKNPSAFLNRYIDNYVDARYETRLGEFHAISAEVIERFRENKALGLSRFNPLKSTKDMDDTVRELFGQKTNNKAASDASEIMREVSEKMIAAANRAGADIASDPRYHLPQAHSPIKMAKSRDEWVAFHMDNLDWDTMTKWNDGLPIPAEKRPEILNSVYDTLISDGYSKIKPGAHHGKNFLDIMSSSRFMHYKDADAWLEANKRYGDGSSMQQFFSRMDAMARDIALLDVMGPHPTAQKTFIQAMAKQAVGVDAAGKQSGSAIGKVDKAVDTFDRQFRNYTNQNAASPHSKGVNAFRDVSNVVVSSLLGSTTLVALVGDMAKSIHRSAWSNTPSGKILKNFVKQAALPGGKNRRRELHRTGLVLQSATQMGTSISRMFGDPGGNRWSLMFSDTAHHLTMLTQTTEMAKHANTASIMGAFADHRKMSFEKLPFRAVLEENGIEKADWDLLRTTDVYDPDGFHLISPMDLRSRTDIPEDQAIRVADKFMDFINRERKNRVIESSQRTQEFLKSDLKADKGPSAVITELTRLKSFPVEIIFRTAEEVSAKVGESGRLQGAAYASSLLFTLTMAGAMAMQAQHLASGRDPIDMSTPEFWAAAIMKGGGLGVLGDFAFANTNRYGQGLSTIITGPTIDFYNKARNLTLGNIQELVTGEDTDFVKELLDFGRQYAPLSKTWWYKLPLQRGILDQVQKEIDPKAYSRMKKRERDARSKYNQEYWWGLGDNAPSRAPDFSSIFGE